ETLVSRASDLARDLKNTGLTTSQIRALFGEVRQIQAQWKMGSQQQAQARRRLSLLKPKMAYRAKRERKKAVEDLVAVLDPALNLVIGEKDADLQTAHFQRFVEFFEAILAYHKAYGGN
ncbi:MAG: type III-A CRISPR-associated protein Csm2, partial [Caldilineaceae bacterium]|nr:type III-A CRISPR-associated protein Csm2 [Caldilineaceae bacterium]